MTVNKNKQGRVWLLASGFYSGSSKKACLTAVYVTDTELLKQDGKPFDIGQYPSAEACMRLDHDPGGEAVTSAAYKIGAEYAAIFEYRKIHVWDHADACAAKIKTPADAKVQIAHVDNAGQKLERIIPNIMDALDQLAAAKAIDPTPPDGSTTVETVKGDGSDADA